MTKEDAIRYVAEDGCNIANLPMEYRDDIDVALTAISNNVVAALHLSEKLILDTAIKAILVLDAMIKEHIEYIYSIKLDTEENT